MLGLTSTLISVAFVLESVVANDPLLRDVRPVSVTAGLQKCTFPRFPQVPFNRPTRIRRNSWLGWSTNAGTEDRTKELGFMMSRSNTMDFEVKINFLHDTHNFGREIDGRI